VDDIGQDTFVQFYKSLHRFRGDSSIGTYLTRIAINLSLNELKRRGRREKLFAAGFRDDLGTAEAYQDRELANDTKDIVRRGIEMLEPELKALIVLRLINGYTTRETADILRLPVGTVLSRLARAQVRLRDILREVYNLNHL
jgi:RNA polymerase sigma-70 factor (ECF subfamily)